MLERRAFAESVRRVVVGGLRVGWLRDAGLGVVFAVVIASWASRVAGTWGAAYWRFGCVAGVVVCVIALGRRRHRLGAAVAGLVVAAVAIPIARLAELPAEPGPGLALGLAVLIGSAVAALPERQAVAVVLGGLAVLGGSLAAALTSPSSHLSVVALNGAGWLAAVAGGLTPRLLRARHHATTERVRRQERLALARELHDVVAHHVTCVVLQAQATRLVARRHPERVEGSLTGIETAGSEALAATRRVVGLLRESGGAAFGEFGPDRLGELIDRFNGPPVRLRLPAGEQRWPPEIAGTVYRVVQEALTNVSRHAPHARSVTVSVARGGSVLTVEVADDAPPARARPRKDAPAGARLGGGYGLVGMRERVEALGGTLTAGPRHTTGWKVLATLPVTERAARPLGSGRRR
ncbi:histidine kinase [Nonomuraea sp. NPDC050643]|uniref:sensor histidine kinase n=1 Tax=Nonomuraea sp. NPDC050643 TaxID=3155660 RepID=UPI0033DF54A0